MHEAYVQEPGAMPNFIIIGAMKSGTTSLYHYLREHPQVHMSPIKELDFFVEEFNWHRGLTWYRRQFNPVRPRQTAVGEASTSYTKHPRYGGVPERISRCLPQARLIYVVRDPIERIRSHYHHNVTIGKEPLPLERAIFENPNYVNYSRYTSQLRRYLDHFAREQMLVISAEDLRERRTEAMSVVCRFLDIDESMSASALAREYYKTKERLEYPRLISGGRRMLRRRFPSSVGLARYVPYGIKRRLGRPVAREERGIDTDLSPAARARVEDGLREEVAALRDYLGEGFDGWGIG